MPRAAVIIDKEEYNFLVTSRARTVAFRDYVLATEFSVDRKICAAILGFKLEEQVSEDAGTD